MRCKKRAKILVEKKCPQMLLHVVTTYTSTKKLYTCAVAAFLDHHTISVKSGMSSSSDDMSSNNSASSY